MRKISVIVAHPDDEVLGCGGTIIKHKFKGDKVSFLWMTNGIDARDNVTQCDKNIRLSGLNKAIEYIKPPYWEIANLPDNKLDSLPLLNLVKVIESFLEEVKPDVVYTHFLNDLNIDHALTCRAVMTATRPCSKTFVREIYSFEVPSSTEWGIGIPQFTPDTYIDITPFIEAKEKYLRCYEDEMRAFPHPRSIENIIAKSQIRGAEVNLEYAEAFMTLRRVIHEQPIYHR